MPRERRVRTALVTALLAGLLVAPAVLLVGAPAGADELATPAPTGPASPSASASASASASPTDEPTPTPAPSPTSSAAPTTPASGTVVEDAVLRWGINDESSNRAYAPGTFNFLSAGLVADPGRGGTTLASGAWRQAVGRVAIEKWNGATWAPATWAGLSTDSSGAVLGAPSAGTFSHHRFAMSGGTGLVDAAAGTASISWDGDVTVLYYSGMSFFHVSDPALQVAGGAGTLTATVSGYASSVADPTAWSPVPAVRVVLAVLPAVDLGDVRSLTAQPAYLGVPASGVAQVTTGPHWGSFPQGFVDYMDRLGTAAFWVSSGAATDAFKVPLPVTVAYDAAADVPAPAPSSAATTVPAIENPTVTPAPTPAPTREAPVVPTPVEPQAPAAPVLPAPAPVVALPPTVSLTGDLLGARPVAAPLTTPTPPARLWWVGGALLLAAAVALLVPVDRVGRRTS